ncbi:MAG: hypothetical protein ABI345_04385 [Jatrophihabitans sp.]
MRNSSIRRLLPLLGLVASATLMAGCGSSSSGNGTFNSPSVKNSSVNSSANTGPSTLPSVSTPSVSTPALPTTGGGSGADAAFCSVIKTGYSKITGAGSDPSGAADVFEQASQVAPAQVKSDAEYVAQALRNPSGVDISKVTDATRNVLTYYATHCATS